MKLRRWLHEHSLKILAIRDTPNAIAGGIAIGVFFGFMPILGLKTLSAIFFAWITGSNILAAVLAGALHDVILPAMPAVYLWEYDIGFWLLSHPHHWPPIHKIHWEWATLFALGKPLLVGGVVCSAPLAVLSYFVAKPIVASHQRKRKAREAAAAEEETNPT